MSWFSVSAGMGWNFGHRMGGLVQSMRGVGCEVPEYLPVAIFIFSGCCFSFITGFSRLNDGVVLFHRILRRSYRPSPFDP
jgi:hypothetical protein